METFPADHDAVFPRRGHKRFRCGLNIIEVIQSHPERMVCIRRTSQVPGYLALPLYLGRRLTTGWACRKAWFLIAAWGHLAAEKTNAWKEQEMSAIHPANFWLGGQGWPTPPSHMTARVVSPCTSITEHLALFETFHHGVNPFQYKYFFSFIESLSEKLQYVIKSGKCIPSAALSSSR